ncbi:hypothetical protein [uncultured Faecalibaculum sp.]|uniref:hypothetical protein n=2 Tax=uncultured Faecalibaculum sp. TaxID=1729681 RepID=UPI00272CD656|nr:hypothetical protein [uncultured Faecalibaculum sp.]
MNSSMDILSRSPYTKVMRNNENRNISIYDPMNARDVDQLTKIIVFRELDLFDEQDLIPIDRYEQGTLLERFPSLENCFCLVRHDRLICVIGCFMDEVIPEEYPDMVVNIFSGPQLMQVDKADLALVWDRRMEFHNSDSHIQA